MSRKRLPWHGPLPQVGDYLEARVPGRYWQIRAVEALRRPDVSGAALVLELAQAPPCPPPSPATVHLRSRYAPHDPQGPPRVRQVVAGPAAVMRASWRDPEDLRPNARRPREVTGYRSSCPLRRMSAARGSPITERHVAAADHLRTLADLARIGFSGRVGVLPISAAAYGPRAGPTAAAIRQAFASVDLSRCLRRFPPSEQLMLIAVVLLSTPIIVWCWGRLDPKAETRRLVGILDRLTDHYSTEVDAALAAERPVRAA